MLGELEYDLAEKRGEPIPLVLAWSDHEDFTTAVRTRFS
jgi:hypothetical protein